MDKKTRRLIKSSINRSINLMNYIQSKGEVSGDDLVEAFYDRISLEQMKTSIRAGIQAGLIKLTNEDNCIKWIGPKAQSKPYTDYEIDLKCAGRDC